MGLDSVELVMAFEEKFGITIPDEEAEKIVTPRHVIDYVYAQLQHADAKTCLTQRAFYRLRRTLQSEMALPRTAVKPATPLASVVPIADRQAVWRRLKDATAAVEWPNLYRSHETVLANGVGSVAVGMAVWAGTVPALPPSLALVIAVAAGTAAAVLLARATEHLRMHFARPATVGQLAEFLVARDTENLKSASEGWSRDQVREVVRAIIVEHLNIDPDFSDDASFVDDLGLD